ncbi:TonB-dependent receptor [Nitritalea halalkaliphila]|nr:TonB-dependent receptor plug domain-containing protein [Nitritalea halalkaliphila]
MPTKMGIQAMLPDGSGKALKGEVVLAGESFAFETNARGLGSISFPALKPERLTGAGIRFSGLQGPPPAATLPPMRATGISLSVTNFENKLLNISAQNNHPALEAQALYLLVHNRGAIGHLERVSFAEGNLNSRVRTEGLAYGINQITLLTEEGVPLAERLMYVHNRPTPEMRLETDRLDFAPRAKNTFSLALPPAADFQDGRFSVSITDALESGDAAHQSLPSFLYLSADLEDFHLPATELLLQYRHEDMEEVMLTHGWRRFDWEDLMGEKYQNSTFIEQGINLIGQVSPAAGIRGKLRGGSISVFVEGEEDAFLAGDYGPNGNFLFDALEFYDTTQVTISVKDGRLGTLVDLNLEESPNTYAYWEEFSPFRGDFTLSEALLEALAQARKRKESALAFDESSLMEMDEFVVEADKYDAVEEGIDRMYGQGDVTLRTADIPGSEAFLDIWQLIQGRVPGVRVTYNIGGQPSIVIRGSASFGDEAPIVLLDNMPVDYMTAGMIPPRDVSAIDIFKDGASLSIFGASGGGGVIAIYTKRGLGDPSALGEGMFLLQFPGYARAATFYQPPYEQGPQAKPDYRGTLYWNADLRLDANGRVTLPFFNSDVAKTYRVVLQGLDATGQALYQEWLLGPEGLLPTGED